MSSELSLSWDDHPKTLLGVFEKLLETSTLVDCTIAAEGQYLKAHKIILSACSPYFQLLFSQENEKNPIVVLKDIKFQELKAMIDFMYRGKVKVPEERLGDFVDAAESLQIKGLGRGNSQKTSSHDTGKGDPDIQKRWSQASPLPHKRQRCTDFQDGLRRPVHVVNFESKISEEQSYEICVEQPNLCQDETRPSVSSAINSPTSLPSDVSSEMKNVDLTKSVSFAKLPLLPCEEAHPIPDSVVVKSELEAMTEVDIQEPDFYIEAKEEELEVTGGETNSEIATNQFPDYSMTLQSTSTRPETVLLPLAQDSTSTMGAVPPFPRTRKLPSAMNAAPCMAGSGSCVDGVGVCGSPGALQHRAKASLDAGDLAAPPPPNGAACASPSSGQSWAKHDHKSPPRHRCPQCRRTFRTLTTLAVHRRQHAGERRFPCDSCGKSFHFKCVLKKHQRVHTGERPFACDLCGKTYTLKDSLQSHLLVHTGQCPYSCGVCGKSFMRNSVLQDHMRGHGGERPYACGVCGSSFKRKRNLQEHELLHTGRRPYRCNVCGMTFVHRSSMRYHQRQHTNDHVEPLCGGNPAC